MPRKSRKKEKKIDSRKKVSRKTAAKKPAVARASSGKKTSAVIQNDQVGRYVADAVLRIDTLWGGDVMCPSGTDNSSPIAGFPTNLCPLPTRIRPQDGCAPAEASRQERRSRGGRAVSPRSESSQSYRGHPRGSGKLAGPPRPAQALSGRPDKASTSCRAWLWNPRQRRAGPLPSLR